jgi:putative DNA primase/helicase
MCFAHGTGANGKSVETSTVAGIMADYHVTAPIEAFVASTTDRHPTDMASMRGARLVSVTETEEGRSWAESKLKALTGGDKISARFMRQDFFEYVPQFKLWIAGNHKPQLRNVDEAMRRRLHLVPFTVTIPKHERDQKLAEKIKAEWPGILHWLIQGCLEWQHTGLEPPDAVRDATAEYFSAENAIEQWLEECPSMRLDAFTLSSALYRSYKDWIEARGEHPRAQKHLTAVLQQNAQLKFCRKTNGRGFQGIAFSTSYAADEG